MKRLKKDIQGEFLEMCRDFFDARGEETLNRAYELGRRAANEGMGALQLVHLYADTMKEMQRTHPEIQSVEFLTLSMEILSECIAPFDMRHRGFRDLIFRLNEQNRELQDEVEKRKQMELKLAKSKRHFQNLIENALDIITMIDFDGVILFESPSVHRILGYQPYELIGKNTFDLIHPEDVNLVRKRIQEIINNSERAVGAEYRIRHKDGSWIFLESIASQVVDPIAGDCMIVNSREVTDRVVAREKLKRSEQQLVKAQQIGRFGSWEFDPKTNEMTWSAELCRIFGIGSDQYPRTFENFLNYLRNDQRQQVRNRILENYRKQKEIGFEFQILRPDGFERTLYGRGEVVYDELYGSVRMIGTMQDITEIKKATIKLRNYSEQLQRLTAHLEKVREEERIRIARELHDELGQMLSVLKMDIYLARDKAKKRYGKTFIESWSPEMDRIFSRIDTIIHSVQRISSELRPEILNELGLEDAIVWHLKEFEKNTRIKTEFENMIDNLDDLTQDRTTSIFRILQETMTNILRHAEASRVKVRLEKTENYLNLTVKDDGVGIEHEELDKPDSLGITGMRERAHLLGGTIHFEGEKGVGTRVTLEIPVEEVQTTKPFG